MSFDLATGVAVHVDPPLPVQLQITMPPAEVTVTLPAGLAPVGVEGPATPGLGQQLPSAPDVLVATVAGPPGPVGPAGPPGIAGGQVVITRVAAVPLSGHRVVTAEPGDTVDYASNTDPSAVNAPLWITLHAAAAGAPVDLLAYGELVEPSWSWLPGPLYLGTNGVITQTLPSAPTAVFLAQVGGATGPTAAFIDRQPSIVLT